MALRIREAREAAGLSQTDMGKKLGLTKAGYGHYERGRQPFTVDMIFQISRILGHPVEYFLGLDTGLSDDEGQLLASYRAIDSDDGKRLALTVVRDSAVIYTAQPPASRSS